ncbi:hypothetical protein ZWY2020_011181 [Hordeum vulgare]|nr:hypothetical protein ZWY2020_011181 [Hordeum vulgare]
MAVSQRRIRPRAHAWLQSAPTRHQHHQNHLHDDRGRQKQRARACNRGSQRGSRWGITDPSLLLRRPTDGVRSGDPDRRRGGSLPQRAACTSCSASPEPVASLPPASLLAAETTA